MINCDMRKYSYLRYGEINEYGSPALSNEIVGEVKMAINISSLTTQDNILYKDCSYIGLTTDAEIDDKYVILYNNERLKVLYVNDKGRYKQVFMKGM